MYATISSPTSLFNFSTVHSLLVQFPNASYPVTNNSSNVKFPALLPHRINIPNTSTTLDLGFGIWSKKIDPNYLRSLLVVTQDYVNEQIEALGAQTLYPVIGIGIQDFYKTLGDDVHIEIWNLDPQAFFTWETLKNVIAGLWTYLVEGRRYRQCWFKFREDGAAAAVGAGHITNGMEEARSVF